MQELFVENVEIKTFTTFLIQQRIADVIVDLLQIRHGLRRVAQLHGVTPKRERISSSDTQSLSARTESRPF